MKQGKVLYWAIVVSLGGFLFGLDTAVISGCEQTIQQLFNLSSFMTGLMVAMALVGTVFGSLLGGIPAEIWGRKPTLVVVGVLYLLSAIGCAVANDVYTLMFFRFVGGVGVGASSVVAPMYISEIAPTEKRGQLTAIFQFNLVFGILIAYFSNWVIGTGALDAWRWMLGIVAVPSVVFLILLKQVPESPRWLFLKKGDKNEAKRVVELIYPDQPSEVEHIMSSLEQETSQPGTQSNGFRTFLSGRYNWPILLAFLFAFFNQVSGINAVIYYAPRIFAAAGLGGSTALLSSVGIGVINLLFTMLGLVLIDRFGRRFLMVIGSVGYILSLAMLARAFYMESTSGSMQVPIWLFVFIASHAIGQGAVIWVFISEIFPNHVRAYGNSLGSGTHWIFAVIIAWTFPYFAEIYGPAPLFALFAIMMVFQLLFVRFMMPETAGVSLEEMEENLKG